MFVESRVKSGRILEISRYYMPEARRGERAPKARESSAKKRERNFYRAYIYLARLINEHFAGRGVHLTCDYATEPEFEQGKKDLYNYMRRLNRARKKQGYGPLKYIAVTEYQHARYHHHVIVSRIDYATAKRLWTAGNVHYEDLGFYEDYISLAKYLLKERRGEKFKKKWVQSQGLQLPEPEIRETEPTTATRIPRGYKIIDMPPPVVNEETGGVSLYIRCYKMDAKPPKPERPKRAPVTRRKRGRGRKRQ